MPAAEVVGRSNRDLRIPGNDKALQALENSIRFVFQTGLNATYYTQRTFPEGIRYYYMKLTPGFIDGTTQVESVWAITPEINTLKQYEKNFVSRVRRCERRISNWTRSMPTWTLFSTPFPTTCVIRWPISKRP